jgi:hypothetical protein
MRVPENINTADLRYGILCTRGEVIKRIEYLTECIEQNDLNGHANCKENRQMRREIRRLTRYGRWLGRLLKEVW